MDKSVIRLWQVRVVLIECTYNIIYDKYLIIISCVCIKHTVNFLSLAFFSLLGFVSCFQVDVSVMCYAWMSCLWTGIMFMDWFHIYRLVSCFLLTGAMFMNCCHVYGIVTSLWNGATFMGWWQVYVLGVRFVDWLQIYRLMLCFLVRHHVYGLVSCLQIGVMFMDWCHVQQDIKGSSLSFRLQ